MIKGFVKHTILISVVILSMLMIYSSMLKLVSFQGMEESFALWGYGKSFMIIIGIYELIVAILTFITPWRKYGLIGIVLLMIGALYTHITSGDAPNQMYTAIFVFFLAISTLVLQRMQDRGIVS